MYDDVLRQLDVSDDTLVLGENALLIGAPNGRTKYCLMSIIYKSKQKINSSDHKVRQFNIIVNICLISTLVKH